MATLNSIECVNSYKNVGFGNCVFDPGIITGMLLFGQAKSFTAEEVADLQATLQAMTTADGKINRLFPLHNFVEGTDNKEAPVVQTFGYGKKALVRDGDYDMSFDFTDGALCLLTALQTFNGATPFLLYDKNNVIIGTTINGLFSTIPSQFFHAHAWGLATGSTVAKYTVQVVFNSAYINQQLGFVKAGFAVTDLEGLKDVELVVNSFNEGTGVANVTLQTLCNKINIYDALSAELAVVAVWSATNGETGEAITVTSVAGVAGNKTFNVTLNAADPDFPDTGTIDLNLAAPSVLVSNDIEGYEGISVEIEIGAS